MRLQSDWWTSILTLSFMKLCIHVFLEISPSFGMIPWAMYLIWPCGCWILGLDFILWSLFVLVLIHNDGYVAWFLYESRWKEEFKSVESIFSLFLYYPTDGEFILEWVCRNALITCIRLALYCFGSRHCPRNMVVFSFFLEGSWIIYHIRHFSFSSLLSHPSPNLLLESRLLSRTLLGFGFTSFALIFHSFQWILALSDFIHF